MTGLKLHLALGLSNLLEHRRRSALIGAAIAAVTCLFVLLNALSAGISNTLAESATTVTTGHVNVGGFYKLPGSAPGSLIGDHAGVAKVVAQAVPELEFVVARGRGFGVVASDRSSTQLGLGGIDIRTERRFKQQLQLVAGDLDALERPNTLLIFESHARKLDVKVGDRVTISTQTLRNLYNTADCEVGAIARDVGLLSKFSVFMSIDTLRELYQLKPNTTSVLMLYLPSAQRAQIDAIAQRLRGALASAGYRVLPPDPRAYFMKFQSIARDDWTGQKLDVSTWQDEASFLSWTVGSFRGLSAVLMFILIAIVGAGIMNTLWIAIRERTREIGSLRAIGMQRTSVASMFLVEAALLGALASTAGAGCGAFFAWLLNAAQLGLPPSVQLFMMRDTLMLRVEPAALAVTVCAITLVTGLAALFPSLRAARLRPIDAMSHVG